MGPSRLDPVICSKTDRLRDAMTRMANAVSAGLPAGIVLICDAAGRLEGVMTDGDVRRGLLRGVGLDDAVEGIMQPDPIVFPDTMSYTQILQLIPRVIEERDRYRGGVVDKIVLTDGSNRPTKLLNFYQLWEHQITQHRHLIVVGLGFVGLTLSLVLAEHGFKVTGIESDADIRAMLRGGEPHFHEVGIQPLLRECLDKTFRIEETMPNDGDVFIVTVGTPLDASGRPDLTHVERVAREIGGKLRPGCLVILRSTVPVGTTRDIALDELERASGLTGGIDFHLAYAPERTVEGDALKELRELPQVVGGLTPNCLDVAAALFANVTPAVVRVDSLEEAELVKIVNNGFRDTSFAFSNQIAQVCEHFNIDAHSLIRAANQGYTRNPLPKPSPGVGGVCLQKDPYILGYVIEQAGIANPLVLSGREVNESMPGRVVDWVEDALASVSKELDSATVLLAGMAFKGRPETSDMRGSSSLRILERLIAAGCQEIRVHDPVVPLKDLENLGQRAVSLAEGFEDADAALFLTNHQEYGRLDIAPLLGSMRKPAVLFDGWDLFDREMIGNLDGIVYQGLGYRR